MRAKAAEVKEASIVRFGSVIANYRRYLVDNNKDYDHAKSRIDAIETFYGPERDIETLTYPLYEELIAEVGCFSAAATTPGEVTTCTPSSTTVCLLNNRFRGRSGCSAGTRRERWARGRRQCA